VPRRIECVPPEVYFRRGDKRSNTHFHPLEQMPEFRYTKHLWLGALCTPDYSYLNMLDSRSPSIWVVIPTYNEADNILGLIPAIFQYDYDLGIIVVDDDSEDDTAGLVLTLADPRIQVIRRTGQRGYGSAVLTGFQQALLQGAELILSMDADLSHSPERIPHLIKEAAQAEIVIGSRYCPGGGIGNWPLHRKLLSRFANGYVQTLLKMPVKDSTSGFRCYHRHVIENLNLAVIQSEGYSFLVEILYRAYLQGARIHEIPIQFMDRLKGKSKISPKEIYRSIYMVARLKLTLGNRSIPEGSDRSNLSEDQGEMNE
jgi:dolichol-phosphate mannosyltransferase